MLPTAFLRERPEHLFPRASNSIPTLEKILYPPPERVTFTLFLCTL